MSAGDDDFGDAGSNAAMDEVERHSAGVYQLVQEYMDQHDLLEEIMSVVLLNLSMRMRMMGYALETEKPSASGLRLDLDRLRGEIDSCIRAAKKGADQFIEEAKAARAKAETEADEEPDDEGGAPS